MLRVIASYLLSTRIDNERNLFLFMLERTLCVSSFSTIYAKQYVTTAYYFLLSFFVIELTSTLLIAEVWQDRWVES